VTPRSGTPVEDRAHDTGHEVHVSPLAWALWNARSKEGFAASAAIYCAARTASGLQYVDVIDSQSGKKLAHYGPFGFEVF
jgi:hypothetical protein